MPIPAIIVLGAAAAAAVAYLARRWPAVPPAAGVAAMVALIVVVTASPVAGEAVGTGGLQPSWVVFGRALNLTAVARWSILFAAAVLALLFLLSMLFWQGRSFVPLSLAILSALAAALMIQPFLFGAVFIFLASALLAVLVQGERAGPTLAAVRIITMGALAMPLLLVAGWMSGDGQAGDPVAAAWVVLGAVVVLLAGFPFHLWVAPIVAESRSLAPVVLFGLGQFMLVVFFLGLFQEVPAIQRNAFFMELLQVSGAVTAMVGGLLALTSHTFGGLIGYVLLIDIGASLLSLGLGGLETGEVTLALVGSRLVGLMMAGVGLALMRRQIDGAESTSERFDEHRGLTRQTPLGVALYLLGGLALAGAPLTPGFAGRYAIVALAGEQSAPLAAALALGAAAATLAVLRQIGNLTLRAKPVGANRVAETPPMRLVAAGLLGAAALFGLLPGLLPSLFLLLAGLF